MQSSKDSMTWQEGPSGGVSLINYMMPSGHENYKDPTTWNTLYGRLPLEGTTWNFRGTAADGKVRFMSTMDVTGAISDEHVASVSYRLVSLYLLFALNDESIAEAYECLSDVYTAQLSRLRGRGVDPAPRFEGTVRAKHTGALW